MGVVWDPDDFAGIEADALTPLPPSPIQMGAGGREAGPIIGATV